MVDLSLADASKTHVFEMQVDRDGTVATLQNVYTVDSQRFQHRHRQSLMAIWMVLHDLRHNRWQTFHIAQRTSRQIFR